jgi:hypothetical protein
MQSEATRPGGASRPSPRPTDTRLRCDGVLIQYAWGEGCCDRGHRCEVYDVRWSDHDAYLAAHHRFARPGDRTSKRNARGLS